MDTHIRDPVHLSHQPIKTGFALADPGRVPENTGSVRTQSRIGTTQSLGPGSLGNLEKGKGGRTHTFPAQLPLGIEGSGQETEQAAKDQMQGCGTECQNFRLTPNSKQRVP